MWDILFLIVFGFILGYFTHKRIEDYKAKKKQEQKRKLPG